MSEVGDAWLDAGIVPFSTLGWQNAEWIPGRLRDRRAEGLSGADLPDHEYWEKWFPADWVSEMREQIRLWFYSQLFMSVALVGARALPPGARLREAQRRDGSCRCTSPGATRSSSNEALERMGADVMRWLYCAPGCRARTSTSAIGPAGEVKRRLLTLWNTVSFLVLYAATEDVRFRPRYTDLDGGSPTRARAARPVAPRALERAPARVRARVRRLLVAAGHGDVRALHRRPLELVRAPSRAALLARRRGRLPRLWYAIVQSLRTVAPIMPFLAEHLWQQLVAAPCGDAPESILLAGWPAVDEALLDEALLAEMTEVRRVVDLGRAARAEAGIRLRQPLRELCGADASLLAGYEELIADELRVKSIRAGSSRPTRFG